MSVNKHGAKDSSSMNGNILSSKSPRSVRKKRFLSSQARRSHSLKDKIINRKHKVLLGEQDISSNSNIKNECFGEFQSAFCSEITGRLFSQTKECMQGSMYRHRLKHSFSFPGICYKPLNDLVLKRSHSVHITNPYIYSNQELSTQIQIQNSDTESAILSNENLFKNSLNNNYVENISNGRSFSCQSSTSTLHARNSSIDSLFSQVSVSDIKEVEGTYNDKKENPVSQTKRKSQHSRSKSDDFCDPNSFEYIENSEIFSLPNSFSGCTVPQRKSIFEGKQMAVPTECFFPRPQQGQSLTSFLSSNEFSISAELDRENAHFCISEALIAAIEHMKFSRMMKIVEEEDESDEEIRKLTQRIRYRRRERQKEKSIRNLILLSDGKTDTATSQSASPPISSHSSDFEVDSIGSEDEVEDLELSAHTDSNLSSLKENGLSLSMASLYSDADLHKASLQLKESEKKLQDSDSNNLSAESVALSLISRFSEKHLPKASELQWLVSEQDAPQKLLPLPNSWPISPDALEEEYNLEKTRLRGNFEWAPPRPQIIFSILPNMKRKDIIENQKYRCAGCGMKIEKNYVSRFRYCSYFGKYFCQCCHSNNLAHIPGRILWKWDFTKYYVSKFAWELLDQMYSDPLFNIDDINKNLYQKIRQLELCRINRMQIFYLKDFINTCRKAELIQETLKTHNHHIVYDPHMYSISDLVQVKSGELMKHLRNLVNLCMDHVKQCILCQAKGFICEICQKDNDIIFPFQLDKVILCQVCGSCFHKNCMKNLKCPRCIRIAERKKRMSLDTIDEGIAVMPDM